MPTAVYVSKACASPNHSGSNAIFGIKSAQAFWSCGLDGLKYRNTMGFVHHLLDQIDEPSFLDQAYETLPGEMVNVRLPAMKKPLLDGAVQASRVR